MTTQRRTVDVVIVGAGFAGLYALYKMREIGLTAQVFEAADDVGGVWYWNRYPGARCDVQSLEYSYSFSSSLEQEWDWTERYAMQPEILAYLRHVADRFDLRRDIAFETRVVAALFDEQTNLWHVRTECGGEVTARFCIMASGSLSVTRLPNFLGIKTFRGAIYHTGNWPPGGVDFTGKRVAVIGTGSSGVQSIPIIAAQAAQVTVFQRTPNFVVSAKNRRLASDEKADWKAKYADHRKLAKRVGSLYDFSDNRAADLSEAEREVELARRWEGGGVNFVHAFNDIFTDQDANDSAADFVRARIRDIVENPDVAKRLCPTDHPIGTKRICVGSDYYATYNQPNVRLIDLRATPIIAVTTTDIRTTEAIIDIDVIVCATGYDALTGALARIDIRGRDGLALKDKWASGPRNYLGLMSAHFPNLFVITGPGSPSVLVNMVVGIEQHVDWIADCITHLATNSATTIEPTEAAEDAWVQRVNEEADKTLFPKANSWYNGANVDGKPRVFLPFVGGIGRYRDICDTVADDNYAGFTIQ